MTHYTIRVKATKRNLGDWPGADPCEALAAFLLSRGHSSAALLANVLDGLEVVPTARDFAESLADLGSKGHAEIAGALAGAEFAARLAGAEVWDGDEPRSDLEAEQAAEADPCHACGGSGEVHHEVLAGHAEDDYEVTRPCGVCRPGALRLVSRPGRGVD